MKGEEIMKLKNAFWGLFFVAAAAVIIINQLGLFGSIGLFGLVLTLLMIPIIITSARYLHFSGIFFPLALICIIFADDWGISNLVPWTVLLTALFLSIGCSLIFKKKKFSLKHGEHYYKNHKSYFSHTHNNRESVETTEDNTFECRVSFSASSQYINSVSLERAFVACSFGAIKVYFDNAALHPNGAVVDLDVSFGGVELYIPKEWTVIDDVSATFGGMSEKNNHRGGDGPALTITGNIKFSGVEIIYI